jgi:cbb3-type cytochrome oxidase subunit 3
MAVALLALLLAVCGSSAGLAQSPAPAVKLSRSGICHDTASPHYARLKEFTPFDSMDACRRAGGRQSLASAKKQEATSDSTIGFAIVLFAGVSLAVLAWLYWRYRRRRPTDVEAAFRESEQRRWEGHRLDSPKRPRP